MRNLAVRGIYISLALLTFFAVFAATVGAREALASQDAGGAPDDRRQPGRCRGPSS